MSDTTDKTKEKPPEFDFSAFPSDSVFHERRTGLERRDQLTTAVPATQSEKPPGERRAKKERRKRIDPTTFEKQYTEDELEFMSAVQKFKERSGKPFPTYGEVLRVAVAIGYRRVVIDDTYPTGQFPTVNSEEEADHGLDVKVHALDPPPAPHLF